ncbi:MAG: PHP domain-containing protein [Thermomicrobiales bacterium]
MLIDMHLHTRRSKDSSLSFPDAIVEAKRLGLDAICVTEHGRFTSEAEAMEMMARFEFTVLGGVEFSTALGHFLVYDVPSTVSWSLEREALLRRLRALEAEIQREQSITLHRLESRLTRMMDFEIADLVRLVHQAGGVIVWAHPMDDRSPLRQQFNVFAETEGTTEVAEFVRWLGENDVTQGWLSVIHALDGFEILNGSARRRGIGSVLATQIAEAFGKPGTAGSDAHRVESVGRVATRFAAAPGNGIRIGELLRSGAPRVEVLKPLGDGSW